METVEILYYKWCFFDGDSFNSNHIYMNADAGPKHHLMIYCKVEKWIKHVYISKGGYGPIEDAGIRTVPVKREEMEKI